MCNHNHTIFLLQVKRNIIQLTLDVVRHRGYINHALINAMVFAAVPHRLGSASLKVSLFWKVIFFLVLSSSLAEVADVLSAVATFFTVTLHTAALMKRPFLKLATPLLVPKGKAPTNKLIVC